MDRRNFIKSISRNIAIGSLLAGGGYLLIRKGNEDEACNFDFVCRNCKQLSKCKLPEAENYKKKSTEKN